MRNIPSLYVLDVGNGNSSVLVDTEGTIVIDAGPKTGLLDFLTSNEIYEIDVLLLSHADLDHIGGAIALILSDEIKVKKVYLNPDSTKSSAIWDDLVYALYNSHNREELLFETSLTTGLSGKLNQGRVNVEVLAPNQYIVAKGPGNKDNKGRKLTSNSISVVIRLSLEDKPFALLPGDIDHVGLANLFEDHPNMQAWLLVFPHHGGRSGAGDIIKFTHLLCEMVQPMTIIFSIRENIKEFPNIDVIESITQTLDKVSMFTTRSSETFAEFIKGTSSEFHSDCVGNISLDFKGFPPTINFDF